MRNLKPSLDNSQDSAASNLAHDADRDGLESNSSLDHHRTQRGSTQADSTQAETPRSIAVIGGGPMGLATAYRLLTEGHQVTLFEADDRLGGMTASFDFGGVSIERFYHFICKPDQPLFDTLRELRIADSLKWVPTSMGLYYRKEAAKTGRVYQWGRPDALLRFPHLDLLSKIRYGLFALRCCRIKDWGQLDKMNGVAWLKKQCGIRGFNVLWQQLIECKFFEHSNNLSAAWLASRVRRVGKSRKNMFQEELGYLDGGSQVLIDAWEEEILRRGGSIRCATPVEKILVQHQHHTDKSESSAHTAMANPARVTSDEGINNISHNVRPLQSSPTTTPSLAVLGVRAGGQEYRFDQVISTVPLPIVPKMAPDLSAIERMMIQDISYIGVRCILVKLNKRLLPHFWTNISDPSIPIPGLIEYTNLRELGDHIVYAPFYLPHTHPSYSAPDEELIDQTLKIFAALNPNFRQSWVLDVKATRYHQAQTICAPEFFEKLPPIRTSIGGFYMADTSYYYPEDRSISESIGLGELLAKTALADIVPVITEAPLTKVAQGE
jgi:protoporphyrinogen oxidase